MGYLKDNIVGYISRNKKWVIFLAVCLIVIFLSSMIASGIQSDGWKVEVTDLRDAENHRHHHRHFFRQRNAAGRRGQSGQRHPLQAGHRNGGKSRPRSGVHSRLSQQP